MNLSTLLPVLMPIVMVLWGILVKRLPALEKLPNNLIPWLNLLLGVIAKLAAPVPAQAGGVTGVATAAVHALGWLWPPIQVLIARAIYETFLRPTEDMAGIGKNPPASPTK